MQTKQEQNQGKGKKKNIGFEGLAGKLTELFGQHKSWNALLIWDGLEHFLGTLHNPVKESLSVFGIRYPHPKVPNLKGTTKGFFFNEQLDEGFKIFVGEQKLGQGSDGRGDLFPSGLLCLS